MKKRTLFQALVPVLFCVSLLSCGHDDDGSRTENFIPIKTGIAKASVLEAAGCLSVPKYRNELKALNPVMDVLAITKNVQLDAKKRLRPEFDVLASFAAFTFSQSKISSVQDLENISQNGCESFTITGPDGSQQVFKIKDQSEVMIFGQAEDGYEMKYEFLSSTSLQVTSRTVSYDLPCSNEQNPILSRVTKVYDWSGTVPDLISQDSTLAIDASYLAKVARAAGHADTELYETSTDTEGNSHTALSSARLREISNWAPLPEFVACAGWEEPPPPPPEDDGGNTDTDPPDEGTPPIDGLHFIHN
jgi:hypothetical protein